MKARSRTARPLAPFLVAVVTAFLSTQARADLGIEFQIPVLAGLNGPAAQQQATTVQQPEAVSHVTPPGFASPVTQAATPQDAINAAARNLKQVKGDRASWIEIDGQIGVVSTGSASWDPERTNPMLRLREQRLAWMDAMLKAKTQMARFIDGASVTASERMSEELTTRDTETLSKLESRRESNEDIASIASAFVRGAVLYELDEDAQEGRVTVTLVSTPGTQKLGQARSAGVTGVRDIKQALNTLTAEIRAGVVPPTGGRLIDNPVNGTQAWVAFGSAAVSPERKGRLREKELESARLTARMRAEKAMVALLRGESIAEEDVLDARYKEVLSQTDDFLTKTSDTNSETLSEQATESTRESVANGHIPPNVTSFTLESPDGSWQYAILVHGIQPRPQPSRGGNQASPSRPGLTPPRFPSGTGGKQPGQGSNPLASPAGNQPTPDHAPDGDLYVETIGTGATRDFAIKHALLKAVSQVNGTLVKGSSIAAQKYEDAIEDFNGRVSQRTESNTLSAEAIRTTSGGLVDGYTILAEGPLPQDAPERAQGHTFFVRIQAEIPVFDPKNPRPGARETIAVLPLSVGKITLPDDERRLSGDRIADMFTSAITQDLVRDRTFTVLDEKYLGKVDDKRDDIVRRVRDGRADMREILKIGRELTADYVLVGSLEELSFKQWQHFVKIRNKNETRQEVAVDMELRLINVSTGEIEWMDRYADEWDSMELMQRKGEDRSMSPVQFAMVKAGTAIERSLMSHVESTRKD